MTTLANETVQEIDVALDFEGTMSAQVLQRTKSQLVKVNFPFDRVEKAPSSLPTSSVVHLFCTTAPRSYLTPWVVRQQRGCTGTGFVIPGRLIMTNAHVVEDTVMVEVKKQDESRKHVAKVVCIGHDVDLALVSVEDEEFWTQPSDLLPIQWDCQDSLVELYSEVRAVGYPMGGKTVCVTKGVVSRVDAQMYVHPQLKGVSRHPCSTPGNLPIIQIDAAINSGNSGGPTFNSANKVVGVASSGMPGAQNVGYIIPTRVAVMFLDEFTSTGRWAGISNTGLKTQTLENPVRREYLKMGKHTGVHVTSVAPLGPANEKVKPGDILTAIDSHVVSNEGTIALELSQQKVDMPFDMVIVQKPKGVVTKLKLLREGVEIQEEIVFAPIPPLAPRFEGYDTSPEYVMIGGLLFSKLTIPLIDEYVETRDSGIFLGMGVADQATTKWKEKPDSEIVVFLRGLKHTVNLGYDLNCVKILKTFNGEAVGTLRALAEAAAAALDSATGPTCEFIRFGFDGDQPDGADTVILRAADVRKADSAICEQARIAKVTQLQNSPLPGQILAVPGELACGSGMEAAKQLKSMMEVA